jgi:hypothetical protein
MADDDDKRKQRNIRLYESTFNQLVVYAGEHHSGNISDAVEALLLRGMGEVEAAKQLDVQERQAELGEPVLASVLKSILAADRQAQRTQLDRIEVNAGAAHMMVGDLMRCLYERPDPCPQCGAQYPSAPPFANQHQAGAIKAAARAVADNEIPLLPK